MPNFTVPRVSFFGFNPQDPRCTFSQERSNCEIPLQEISHPTPPTNNILSLRTKESAPMFSPSNTQRPLVADHPPQTLINPHLARFLHSSNPNGSPRVSYALICPSAHLNRPDSLDNALEALSTSDLTLRQQSTLHRRN